MFKVFPKRIVVPQSVTIQSAPNSIDFKHDIEQLHSANIDF